MASEVANGSVCSVCGERHVLSMSYSVRVPMAVAAIPEAELQQRLQMTEDQCVIDGNTFFLRGRIAIPVHGIEEPFIWGVWVEVSPKSFVRADEMWRTEGREAEPAFVGYLNNEIPLYGDTYNLEVDVQTQPVGRRPEFVVRDAEHPIAVEQREGISLQRVEEIAEMLHHPEHFVPGNGDDQALE